jgi:hypothetical protein
VHARPHGAFGRRIALHAVIADLVEPRERHGDREAQDGGDDERSHDPLRHTERVKGDVCDLQQQPCDDCIARCDADHPALPQAVQPTRVTGSRHFGVGAYLLMTAAARPDVSM